MNGGWERGGVSRVINVTWPVPRAAASGAAVPGLCPRMGHPAAKPQRMGSVLR